MVLLLASFVSILSCWNFDVLIFQFFQCFFGLHKQRGERRLPYYHGQYLNPMHAGKHGFLTFFFLTFLVSSTPTSLLWTPEAWFKTCQAISDSYYMLFNVSNPWNFQCLQAAAAKLSSLFRRSSGRQCSLTRQDISLSHIFPGAIRLFMVDLVHCIPWPKAFLEVCRTRLESVLTLTIFCRQWVCCILFTFINILSSFKLTCLLFRQGLKGTNWLQ